MQGPESILASPALDSDSLQEEELIAAAKASLPEAWKVIFDLHYRRIILYLEARIGGRGEAEDLAAIVFLRAVKGIKRYVYRGRPLLAWLYGIAANVIKDHRRSLARRPEGALVRLRGALGFGDSELGQLELAAPAPDSPEELLDLRAAVNSLTPEQREVVTLHYFAGLTVPEVALALGKNERAVYSMQGRALAALRRRLVH